MTAPIRVLFLSSSNAARSQMAEALLRRLGGDRFEVYSAGFEPLPIARGATQAMQEIGIDLTGQRSKHINEYLDRQFDHVVVLCGHDRHFCPDFPHDKDTLVWTCDEPTEATGNEDDQLYAFRAARDRLQALIEDWIGRLGVTS
jgi:arsenate reductase